MSLSTKLQRWQRWWMLESYKHMIVRLNHARGIIHTFQMTKTFFKKCLFIQFLFTQNFFQCFWIGITQMFCVFYYSKLWKSVSFFNLKPDRAVKLFGWLKQFSRFYVLRVVWGEFLALIFSIFHFFETFLSFPWWHRYSLVDSNTNGTRSNGMCIRSPFPPTLNFLIDNQQDFLSY